MYKEENETNLSNNSIKKKLYAFNMYMYNNI